ncbi:hypothetical protein Cgig2_023058 [Carnegiea gigantea]|uniref:Uncharacterized protein n=1 Tax=Carnegiea gigantea TaxID=171969 RepID=A0A9Q1Q8J6_9CARY|nr:hypothetical protein Cgig2_023058 [Carnegiea gigantea]
MVQEGRKGAGLKRVAVNESDGCIDDHPQTRLRLSSEDVGDDEAIAEGGEEGSKGKGVDERNNTNESLGKKMDKHKQDMLKWKNGVGEKIEQKLADTYQKMGYTVAAECYNLMLGEYSVELTNRRKLVVKLGQQTYTEIGHTRRIVAIPMPTLMPTTKAMLWRLKICWMVRTFQGIEAHEVTTYSSPQLTDKVVSCDPTPTLVCTLIIKCSFACFVLLGKLTCLPHRR